jgi:signal transduction histidine kinase
MPISDQDRIMSPNCLIAISVLLFAWLATAAYLIRNIKRQRAISSRADQGQNALLLGLMTEKAREARVASDTLEKVARLLNLGIVELPGPGCKRPKLNGAARDFFKDSPELLERLMAEERQVPRKGQGSAPAKTVMAGQLVLDMRQVEVDGRRLLIFTDITEGFNLARELKKKERLALLGQMSGQVAHRIKTPLSVLSGRAQMLARRLAPGTRERLQAESIYDEARDLASEIDEIVSFYRNQQPQIREVSLNLLLNECVKRLNALGLECRAEVLHMDEGADAVRTDPAILSNALYLISQNSLHPESGAERVCFSAYLKDDSSGKRWIEILISDDGKGIDEDARARIFEPFFTTRAEGLGLGLFMARDLIERLGGGLELVSAKGDQAAGRDLGGACFKIILPL